MVTQKGRVLTPCFLLFFIHIFIIRIDIIRIYIFIIIMQGGKVNKSVVK